jgi:4-diphosphocytidyl-2-C-methyl-D-erythritol kinase
MSLKMVKVKAPAKLNLYLDIVGVNDKGYHLMEMLMQAIDLFDVITVEQSFDEKITLSCNWEFVPCNEKNIAYRCAEAFLEKTGIEPSGLHIHLEKRIPQQAGMAGGSADGAGVLRALNRMYGEILTNEELSEIGQRIGADIPFCLTGGTAKVSGIGEKITKISDFPECAFVVAKPKSGVSTQKAFQDFDQMGTGPVYRLSAMIEAVAQGNYTAICENLYNALELVCPLEEVRTIRDSMMGCGAKGAMMTGSGSAVFGLFLDRKRAYECELKLKQKYTDCFLCGPCSEGPVILEVIE